MYLQHTAYQEKFLSTSRLQFVYFGLIHKVLLVEDEISGHWLSVGQR